MVWYITTKWTEQSESLFTQESLDQMEHLVFIEILNFTKKKKKRSSWVNRDSRKAGGWHVIASELKQDQNMNILWSLSSDHAWRAF